MGLSLNFPKCQILLVYHNLLEPLLDLFEELGDPFPALEVATRLKHLGVWIGEDIQEVAWNEIIVKLSKRTREIRDLDLGLAQSIVLFQAFCVSWVYFVAQLFPPSKSLCDTYRSCVRLLTAGPNNAKSYDMCISLKQFGLPIEFPHLEQIAAATRARYIARCDELGRLRSEFTNIFKDDDWCPARRIVGRVPN
eukprot:4611273-Pyramimonas_sp.AAC.1